VTLGNLSPVKVIFWDRSRAVSVAVGLYFYLLGASHLQKNCISYKYAQLASINFMRNTFIE
jgi:hypothetical protein